MIALFNFEATACSGATYDDGGYSTRDAELLLLDERRDVALLLLSTPPPASARPYYAGWTIDNGEISTGALFHCIHHPRGDVRKLSSAEKLELKTYDYSKSNSGYSFEASAHWRTSRWLTGTTESGSSGAPIFDMTGHFVGGLTGGNATCNCKRVGCYDFFWALSEAWDKMPQEVGNRPLSSYLDTLKTHVKKLDGAYFNVNNEPLRSLVYAPDYEQVMFSSRIGETDGYVAGHNARKTSVVAQGFMDAEATTIVYSVMLSWARQNTPKDQTFNLIFYNDNNGLPGDVITTIENVQASIFKNERAAPIVLEKPQTIKGAFHIGVELKYGEAVSDTLAFYHSELEAAELNADNNRAHFLLDGVWRDYKFFVPDVAGADLFFGFNGVVSYTNSLDTITDVKSDNQPFTYYINNDELDVLAEGLIEVEVYDLRGKRIASQSADNKHAHLQLNGILRGIGIVKVKMRDADSRTFKILVN